MEAMRTLGCLEYVTKAISFVNARCLVGVHVMGNIWWDQRFQEFDG